MRNGEKKKLAMASVCMTFLFLYSRQNATENMKRKTTNKESSSSTLGTTTNVVTTLHTLLALL